MKESRSAAAEAAYCVVNLKDIGPEIYHMDDEFYVMEYLEPVQRNPDLLREMESRLTPLWNRPMALLSPDWRERLRSRCGIEAPEWVDSTPCVVHGDCTMANTMRRHTGELVIGDPLGPRPHAPNFREVDMSRMMQSALGWEHVVYGEPLVSWEEPEFWSTNSCRRVLFWTGVLATRIMRDWEERGLLTRTVREWCLRIRAVCLDAARI